MVWYDHGIVCPDYNLPKRQAGKLLILYNVCKKLVKNKWYRIDYFPSCIGLIMGKAIISPLLTTILF